MLSVLALLMVVNIANHAFCMSTVYIIANIANHGEKECKDQESIQLSTRNRYN